MLRDDQAALCWRFAKSGVGDDRFDDVDVDPLADGLPDHRGRRGVDRLHRRAPFELGDHYFVVGRVVDLDHHADPHVPLVFYKGALGGFLAAE